MDRKRKECDLVCIVMCRGIFFSTFSEQFYMMFPLQATHLVPLNGTVDMLFCCCCFLFVYLFLLPYKCSNQLLYCFVNHQNTKQDKDSSLLTSIFHQQYSSFSDHHIQFPHTTCTLCHNLNNCCHQPTFLSFYFICFFASRAL